MNVRPGRTTAAAVTGLFLLLAGCATGPQAYNYAPPQPGSTWRMAAQNTGSFGKDAEYDMTLRAGTWEGQPVWDYANSTGVSTLTKRDNGGFVVVLAPNGNPVATYDPPVAAPYPLEVGRSVTTHHRMTIPGRVSNYEFDYACTVAAYEKLTVRAGEFDAYRVDCTIGNSKETRWYSPQLGITLKSEAVRSADNPYGPGTQRTELVAQNIRK